MSGKKAKKSTKKEESEEDNSSGSQTLPMVPISPSQSPPTHILRSVSGSVQRQTQNQSYCCSIC